MADEKKTLEIVINDAEAAKSLGDIKKSLKDIKNRMVEVGEESPEFDKLAKSAAHLKDKMQEANEAIDNMNPDNLAGLKRIAEGAATGVQLVTSSMALLGSESEEVQKVMMKVQAAMALADAVNNIEKVGKAFQDLYKIIIANPILAVAAAVTAIAIAVEEWSAAQAKNTTEVKNATAAYEAQKKVTEKLDDEYDFQIKLLQAQGASEKDIVDIKKKKIDADIAELKASNAVHAATIQAIKDNDDLFESIARQQAAALRGLGLKKEAEDFDKLVQIMKANRAKDDLDALKENNQRIEDLQQERLLLDVQLQTNLANAAKNARKDDNANRIIEEGQTIQSIDAMRVGSSNFNMELVTSEVQFNQRQYDEDVENLKKSIAAKKEARKQDTLFALNQASSLFGSLSSLTAKHAKLSKAFAIAQALVDTYLGAQKAYVSQLIPADPTSIIRAQIAAGVAVVAGLARVAAMRKVNENGGGGGGDVGGGGSGSIGSISVEPSVNTTAQPSTLLNEQGQVMNQNQQAPIFVSVAEIAAVSGNVTAIEDRSRH